MSGHAYRRQNKKERVAAFDERARSNRRKAIKVAAAPAGAGKPKKKR
jgi:hypothetical protein